MELKIVDTKGIDHITPLEGTSDWYWGKDYAAGDLYEAEEIFQSQSNIRSNRLIFVKFPEGTVYEPFAAKDGQYIGNAVFSQGGIYFLTVDFKQRRIEIHKCGEKMDDTVLVAAIGLDEVRDCYNLMLAVEPLTLIRQGHENVFEIIWPDVLSFDIENTESFVCRVGDKLIFSRWYEDPDYREDVIIRDCLSGDVVKVVGGTLTEMPDGQKWILK